MKPVIILVICISIGAFFYQNYAAPRIQTMYFSLLLSIRQADPALDIPEGVFYQGIGGHSIYVGRRDHRTGMLHDVKIYDFSHGFHDMSVIVSDSARMSLSEDKTMLIFTLYSGEQTATFTQGRRTHRRNPAEFVPFARERFQRKEILIAHDMNFDRMDEDVLESRARHLSLNMSELSFAIDSMTHIVDSLNLVDRNVMHSTAFLTHRSNFPTEQRDSILATVDFSEFAVPRPDTLLFSQDIYRQSAILQGAISRAESNNHQFLFHSVGDKMATQRQINRHWMFWHRMLTMPFTCLIFFFIGAPLGAIVRKGGLGLPIVISVSLFIFYYILDNTGSTMVRDGRWVHWFGMWFSSFILLPMGIFLTYKAMKDSTIMNADTYLAFFRKLFFIPEKRSYPVKQVIIEQPNYETITTSLSELSSDIDT
jgi:lipopolysaccharide export system permease protein